MDCKSVFFLFKFFFSAILNKRFTFFQNLSTITHKKKLT